MKKILFISHALPPYLYPQSIQIGRFLNDLKKRYDVHVIRAGEAAAEDPTLYPDLFADIPQDRILIVPFRQNIRIDQVKNRLLPLLAKRPDVYRAWTDTAFSAAIDKFASSRFDAIVTFSFPLSLNLLGLRLKNHFHCPWIAHQSDPWADNPFMHYGPLTRCLNRRLEKRCFDATDRLVFTNEEAAGFYRRHNPQWADKISFIDHSFDPAMYPPSRPEPSEKIIRYIGGFYGDRTARPLLRALARLSPRARDTLRFEIVGANLKTRLMIQGAKLPPGLLAATGRVTYGESLALMMQSTALLVIDAPIERDNIFFPSKLADYIGAGRPIIGISSPGPTARILKSLGYPCVTHDRVDDLVRIFESIAAGEPVAASGDHDTARAAYRNTVNSARLAEIIDAV